MRVVMDVFSDSEANPYASLRGIVQSGQQLWRYQSRSTLFACPLSTLAIAKVIYVIVSLKSQVGNR